MKSSSMTQAAAPVDNLLKKKSMKRSKKKNIKRPKKKTKSCSR